MIKWLKEALGLNTKPKTAQIAKERLMVIVSHERTQHSEPDFLPMLQKEITEVIAKYVHVDEKQVSVEFEERAGRSILELNITLPEGTAAKAAQIHAAGAAHAAASATEKPKLLQNGAKPELKHKMKAKIKR